MEEEEETRGDIADTIAQFATDYKVEESDKKAEIKKEAMKFIDSISTTGDDKETYTKMFDELSS